MIEARVDNRNGESVLYKGGDEYYRPRLKFVRFGSRPYDMVEFHQTGAFFIPRVRPISWICLSVDKFIEYMEDACRKEKGFFNPPI